MSRGRSSVQGGIGWPWIVLLGLGLFVAGVWVGSRLRPAPPEAPAETAVETPVVTPEPPRVPRRQPRVEMGSPAALPSGEHARIALVIDDLGRSVRDLEALEALAVSMTVAVLPFESRTREVVSEISRRGWEMLLHLPMEPQSGADPGLGALTASMSSDEIRQATRAALAAVPGAVGVNNHMGSILSTNQSAMSAVLEVVGADGLFYLDSRTSADSVGYQRAVELGVPATERQVFLDGDPVSEAIEEQFDRLLSVARERGAAVAIGHPHRATLEVLARRIPQAAAMGYEFVPVSFLLDRVAVTPE